MRAFFLTLAISLMCATLHLAAQQNGTVGLNALQIYNDTSPDKHGPAVVVDVMENTPAAKAGIRNGDLIVALNGQDVNDKTAGDLVAANITGPVGGSVKLTLYRASEGRQFEADLARVPYPLRRNPAHQPFQFFSPASWRPEVDLFPLPWAAHLPYQGSEDLVFAPGFDDKPSPNYHSYAFVWWLEGKQEFSAAKLVGDLLAYYKGISRQRGETRNFKPDLDRVSVTWTSDGRKGDVESLHGDTTFYAPSGELFTLHGKASIQFCASAGHTAGVFILSPMESGAAIWKDLLAIHDSFRCDTHQ
jgi:hypothetical protein